ERLLDLLHGGVRQGELLARRARPSDGRHRLVASVGVHDPLGGLGVVLDVDLLVRDALSIETDLQPTAVTAPPGAVHGDHGSSFVSNPKAAGAGGVPGASPPAPRPRSGGPRGLSQGSATLSG